MTPAQLVLPLGHDGDLSRENFVVAPSNARAIAFVESWPSWKVPAAAIHGPAGSGKTHLVAIWQKLSGAAVISASDAAAGPRAGHAIAAIEDVDSAFADHSRDRAIFVRMESASIAAPLLLTGREPPAQWPCAMPDLMSRFGAVPSFALEAPDDVLLAAVARKLFADRQLAVSEGIIARMLVSLERSPAAVREFVAEADQRALALAGPVNLALVRQLLAEREQSRS